MEETRAAPAPIGMVVGGGRIITIMSGPGGVVRLHMKEGRGEWKEVVLGREHALKLASLLVQAAAKGTKP